MKISTREHSIRINVITLEGRLEAATVAEFRETSQALVARCANVVVDLRRVTFMDSAGMTSLVTLLKRAQQAGGNVVLVKPVEEAAYRILALTRFDRVFRMVDKLEDALTL